MKIRHILCIIKIPFALLSGFIILYIVTCFFVLPPLLKSKLPEILQQETGRKTLISKIEIQPFDSSIRLEGFEIKETNDLLFVAFDVLYVNVGLVSSIKQMALVFDEISLQKPIIHLAKEKNGAFNFQSLFKDKKDTAASKESPSIPITITKFSLTQGDLLWEDNTFDTPVTQNISLININIEGLTTQIDKQANLSLSMSPKSGGHLDWEGQVSLEPLASKGHIKLDNVKLETLLSLILSNTLPINTEGYEQLAADYNASYSEKGLKLNVSKAEFNIHDFKLLVKGDEKAWIKIPLLSLQGLDFSLDKHQLLINTVSANDADFKAWLNPEGVINYQALFPSAHVNTGKLNKAGINTTEPQKVQWDISVNTIALNNFGLDFEDKTLKKPVTINVKPINVKLANYSNKAGVKIPVQLSAGINNTEVITLKGDTIIEPLAANLELNIKAINLEPFQSYFDKFVRLDVIDGDIHIKGNVAISKSPVDDLDLKFKGTAGIANLLTRDQLVHKDLVKWDDLTFKGVDADFLQNRYSAAILEIDKPYIRLIIKKDKTVNFNNIVIADKTKPESLKKPSDNKAAAKARPSFKLDKVKVTDGFSDFSDFSLILPFAAQIKDLDGGASGVSSEQKSKIILALKGNAYDLAPVGVKGDISPHLGDYNVEINFDGLPLPLVSPYMVQFSGYKVEKGTMTLGLKYHVINSELEASNNIFIDRFELGEKVENPNAVSLPIELAIALLQDSTGKIKMDVPITGSLNDPKFSLGAIFTDALANVISKVITAPFRALGSLVGSEKDLSVVSFTPGASYLSKPQQDKLDSLSRALKERSILNLDVKGAAFEEQDWPVLREDALYEELKKRRAVEINKHAEKKIRDEYVELSEDDYKRLLADMFIDTFPLLAKKSFFGKPTLLSSNVGDFYKVAKQKLFTVIKPQPERLKRLASARAQVIANYVVQQGGVQRERVFILDTVIDPKREGNDIVIALSVSAGD